MNNKDDWFYSGEQFQTFFRKSRRSLIIKADIRNFTVLAVSDNYLLLTRIHKNDILNKNLFDVFPGSEADPNEKFSVISSFKRVIDNKRPDELPVLKYNIFVPETGNTETQYWSNKNEPIFDAEGNVAYIINTTTNITDQVTGQHAQERATLLEDALAREQVLNLELSTANEQLKVMNEELQESQQSLALLNFELEERVASRTKALAESEAMMRTAITSANLGTWFLNLETREFIPSARMKELFGYYSNEAMSFDAAIKQIAVEYRSYITNTIEAAISQKTESLEMEYPVIGYHDGKQRWLRTTGKLYQAKAEKQAHFSGTIMDITEHKMDEIRKNDFIAIVSHELKTPLTSLKAYVQMLSVKAKKAEDWFTATALDKVNVQVKKMTAMINGFLNISQLESGKIHLDKKTFDLEELIKERVEEVILAAQSHPINFMPSKPISVYADVEKIGQVINNLLSNAVKYSPKGKPVNITCVHIDGMAQVRVQDEGVGIQPQYIDRIFERFYRVQSNQTKTVSGFGIGLYLCWEIVQRHNGMIGVESEPGKGSTFYFSLPIE